MAANSRVSTDQRFRQVEANSRATLDQRFSQIGSDERGRRWRRSRDGDATDQRFRQVGANSCVLAFQHTPQAPQGAAVRAAARVSDAHSS